MARLLVAGFVVSIAVQYGAVSRCFAQATVEDNEVARLVSRWNAGEFSLEKGELEGSFMRSLKVLSAKKPEGWYMERARIWTGLPPRLTGELPISNYGSAFLQSMFLENATDFYNEVPKSEERQLLVNAKLYLMLSLAQDYAKGLGDKRIEPSHLCVAFANAWTGLWPLCPKRSVPITPAR